MQTTDNYKLTTKEKGWVANKLDFCPSTFKTKIQNKNNFCENVMKCNWKEIVSLHFKFMEPWKNEILKNEKHLNCKMKRKWNFVNFNYKWNVAKFGNANVNLQRIWNEIAF